MMGDNDDGDGGWGDIVVGVVGVLVWIVLIAAAVAS